MGEKTNKIARNKRMNNGNDEQKKEELEII